MSAPGPDAGPDSGPDPDDRLAESVRLRAERRRRFDEGAAPVVRRLGQVGVLGWIVVAPTLAGAFFGRWIDGALKTGVFFTAPLLMLGLGLGCWCGWKWIRNA